MSGTCLFVHAYDLHLYFLKSATLTPVLAEVSLVDLSSDTPSQGTFLWTGLISELSLVSQTKHYCYLHFLPTGESSQSLEYVVTPFHCVCVKLDILDFWAIWVQTVFIMSPFSQLSAGSVRKSGPLINSDFSTFFLFLLWNTPWAFVYIIWHRFYTVPLWGGGMVMNDLNFLGYVDAKSTKFISLTIRHWSSTFSYSNSSLKTSPIFTEIMAATNSNPGC